MDFPLVGGLFMGYASLTSLLSPVGLIINILYGAVMGSSEGTEWV